MFDPNGIPMLSENDKARFWKKVSIGDMEECWLWNGARFDPNGYGRFTKAGHSYAAHRIAWSLHNRRQPGDLLICHTCDNPPCCNPRHLFLGTVRDNARDKVSKGRNVDNRGARHGNAKLSDADVLAIRQLHDMGYSQPEIATRFKIHQGTVSRLINRRRWSHL